MNLSLRNYQNSDLSFLKEMLYEAVYWRRNKNTPSFAEAMALPDMQKDIKSMGHRAGDVALIACLDETPVGAVWIRYWKKEDNIRGYLSDDIPILAIAVKEQFRNQKIGAFLIDGIIQYARNHSINQISLCVSKDNYAQRLYRSKGFEEHTDLDHSFNMVSSIK